jgi:hypothetical protein
LHDTVSYCKEVLKKTTKKKNSGQAVFLLQFSPHCPPTHDVQSIALLSRLLLLLLSAGRLRQPGFTLSLHRISDFTKDVLCPQFPLTRQSFGSQNSFVLRELFVKLTLLSDCLANYKLQSVLQAAHFSSKHTNFTTIQEPN